MVLSGKVISKRAVPEPYTIFSVLPITISGLVIDAFHVTVFACAVVVTAKPAIRATLVVSFLQIQAIFFNDEK